MNEQDLKLKGEPMPLTAPMVCAGSRNGFAGTGDKRPMVYRKGAFDAAALPSIVNGRRIARGEK